MDFEDSDIYYQGFSVDELFMKNNTAIVTGRDAFTLNFTKDESKKSIEKFLSLEDEEARSYFNLGNDARDWKVSFAKKDLEANYPYKGIYLKSSHRPFDERWTFYTGNAKGYHSCPKNGIMHHFLSGRNLALIVSKQAISGFNHIFITINICDKNYIGSAAQFGAGNVFPLYLYPEINKQQNLPEHTERTPNLKKEIVGQIAENLGLTFIAKKEVEGNVCMANNEDVRPDFRQTFAPIDILDYIYAVLHSHAYREKYKESLKIGFPRVPYPKNTDSFWKLIKVGGEIRQIHLLESRKVEDYNASYPKDGNNQIKTKIAEKDWELFDKENQLGRIWINEDQYFDDIPLIAWEFYIGGYQPAQKWLKERRGRTLVVDDILHYQKIIVALLKTDRIMKEMDKIEIE
ncbi:type ISP restriction/modification enzyme [Gillisia sp. Hel_I_86]|uniref:type ISP restriction/modification enzyme n=1 Tax=Gillisia sp. Hel_I_86 TaxID=1249981 RepID=UPI0011A9B169|nr:type ISP restriction/modification enzyme [Gillisia sp. Hel_I_86]